MFCFTRRFIKTLYVIIDMDQESVQKSGYFQGVLQLRNPTEELVRFVREDVSKQPKGRQVYIGREVRLENGYDFYLTSNRYMRTLGRKLQKRFGGQLVESPKVFTRDRQTSKDVFRLSVLLRLPKFHKGDVIKYKGMDIKVKAVGKKVFGVDVKTGRKYMINYKELL